MHMEAIVDRLKALGEPRRLAIVRLLAGGPRNGVALLADLEISQPNLSRHLAVLRSAGLVREKRRGREAFYGLAPDPILAAVLEVLGEGLPLGMSQQMYENASFEVEAPRGVPPREPGVSVPGEPGTGDELPGSPQERDDFQDWLL